MFEVVNRSEESWGPLAKCDDKTFTKLINGRHAKDEIKAFVKKQKKLKTYKVTFKKVWNSDTFEIQAEDDYSLSTAAKQYFKQNEQSIGFREQTRNQWADGYAGYDTFSYTKVRT
jgi:hypothetical protein